MGAKVKMKCPHCGTMFKAANPRQNLCDACLKKERNVRAAQASAKGAAAKSAPQAQTPAPSLKISGPGATIFGRSPSASDVAPPPEPGKFGSAARREENHTRHSAQPEQRSGIGRSQPETPTKPEPQATHTPRAQQPPVQSQPQAQQDARETQEAGAPRSPRPQRPPRQPKEPRPAPQPFQLTEELRERIEARYLALAQPVEFDGIRTQVAAELNIPKATVKKAVAELLKRKQLPSWWELQASTSSPEELDRIRAAYAPLLPTPPIGVHKQLAAELGMDARQVYQGIRRIRAELRLPQYNPPEAHPEAPGSVAKESEPAHT